MKQNDPNNEMCNPDKEQVKINDLISRAPDGDINSKLGWCMKQLKGAINPMIIRETLEKQQQIITLTKLEEERGSIVPNGAQGGLVTKFRHRDPWYYPEIKK